MATLFFDAGTITATGGTAIKVWLFLHREEARRSSFF
jgi:hypothetical protein